MKSSRTIRTLLSRSHRHHLQPGGERPGTNRYLFGSLQWRQRNGPSGPVIQASDGNFYGTTVHGGVNAQGNRISHDTHWTYHVDLQFLLEG